MASTLIPIAALLLSSAFLLMAGGLHGLLLPIEGTIQGFTTVELKSNFLGTAKEGTIRCEASADHLGRTTQVWSVVVHGPTEQGGRKLALFRCTQMVLW